jgi:hypothetical protein
MKLTKIFFVVTFFAALTGTFAHAQTSSGSLDGKKSDTSSSDKPGKKPTQKKASGPKIRVDGIGVLAMGMKDAPSPGVFGFGGAVAYRLRRNIEVEGSLISFGYILDYADANTTVEISDMAINADGIYRMPLSSTFALRGRGGAGMNIVSVKVAGDLADSTEFASASKNLFALNLGGGVEMNFGKFFVAAEIRKPILLTSVEAMGDISILLCGEAGMRF